MRFRLRKPPAAPAFDAPLRPSVPFFAVGDVHGCDPLLEKLLSRLEGVAHPEARLVMVGDYVDRGDFSADVLRRLHRLQTEAEPGLMICLRGNHDQMLIDFLDDPKQTGSRWFRHGGLQTLASYGLAGVPQTAAEAQWIEVRDRLREAMGPEIEAWLRALPLSWQSGNVLVTHAGADPARPPGDQSEHDLLWGHPDFETVPRRDGIWVLHGHTITESTRPRDGRIPVDTGAYATGRLTAVLVETGKVESFSTAPRTR
ncbi:MAG: serine/threonine protein phosphatase [Methylocystaceae bacterium]|nr:serine/threonine protein phosphatase [Methylocystaceae bacterium]